MKLVYRLKKIELSSTSSDKVRMSKKYDASEYSVSRLVGEEKRTRRSRGRGNKRKSPSTTMEVPADRAEEVRRLLERMDMRDEEILEQENEDDFQYEVSRVCNSKIHRDGTFEFLIKFRGYTEPEWVADDDCRCETLIQEYLDEHASHVRTVYGFCRVSSKRQTGPTHVSLAAQEEKIRQTAKSLELARGEVLRIKMFNISSSAYRGIPQQLKYIADCARPRDILITYRVDRLSRNIARFLQLLEDMNEKGILIYAQDESIWYHNRRLDFLQHILDANKEAAAISKRVKLSVEHRRKRGDYIGSAPYGYRLGRNQRTRAVTKEPNPEEQAVIRRIKNTSSSNSMMAQQLNNEGILKRGRTWTTSMVNYVRKYSDFE